MVNGSWFFKPGQALFVTDRDSDPTPPAESWDTYWKTAKDRAAYSAAGLGHPVIVGFWDDYFSLVRKRYDSPRIIDIAGGNGALIERAIGAMGVRPDNFTCLDISSAAIGVIEKRFPGIRGMVADARCIPAPSASYEIAVSQFGLEYAGIEAVREAGRLVMPDGQVAFLMHHRAGSIYRQSAANRDAVNLLGQANFFSRAIHMFEAGFRAIRGADRRPYDAAVEKFAPAIRAVESIVAQYGSRAADGTIMRLYTDIRKMHQRMGHYEPTDILNWLKAMHAEFEAYGGRMTSMCESALDAATFDEICDLLQDMGFFILRRGPLTDAQGKTPLAWVLVAERASGVRAGIRNLDAVSWSDP